MEEVVIVIADLYVSGAAEAASIREVQLPALARIARFGSGEAIHRGWRAWLAEWSGQRELADQAPATVAAAASRLTAETARDRMSWLATPVHLIAGLSSVHLDQRGLLQVEAETRQALAEEFNRVFEDSGFRLEALASSGFLLTGPRVDEPSPADPARILGASVSEVLPEASRAPRLRRLVAEVEMWLHEHPVNIARRQQRRLPITALWLWGGGAAREGLDTGRGFGLFSTDQTDTLPASAVRDAATAAVGVTPIAGAAFGNDPFLHGLWRASGSSARPIPARFEEVLAHAGRRAVFVLELSQAFDMHREWTLRDALADLDSRWIGSALAALRRRDIERVTVVANDHRLSLGARDDWKLWRLPRPALMSLQ